MDNKYNLRRVVITGMGAVSPAGNTMDDTWNGIIEGRSSANNVTHFDASKFPTTIAYEIKDFKFDESLTTTNDLPYLNEAAQYGITAAQEALIQSGLTVDHMDPYRTSVCLGVGQGSPSFQWYSKIIAEERWDDPELKYVSKNFPFMLTQSVAHMMHAKGGNITVHTACASSGQAIGEAFEMIACGERDVIMTGGADSMVNPFHMAGFSLLGALSKRNDDPAKASRPFDQERDGFVLGEGACMLLLEEYQHAVNRGATILAEVVGYGITESAYRITDLHPEGHGPMEAMQMAVDQAGIEAKDVGYVNAHGTSTLLNDRIESLAVSKVFPKESSDVHVSSTKSVTGHMISAAGAIELAVCVKALQHQVLPPSTNLFEQDSECVAKICPTSPTDKSFNYALSNSVGFGGSNTAVVVKRG